MRRRAATGRDASDRSAAWMRLLWPALCRWGSGSGDGADGGTFAAGGLARQRALTDRVWAAQRLDKRRGREARQAMALMNVRWGTCSSVEDGAMKPVGCALTGRWGWRLCRAMRLPPGVCGVFSATPSNCAWSQPGGRPAAGPDASLDAVPCGCSACHRTLFAVGRG